MTDKCAMCYGDRRGECIRRGRCVFESRKLSGPTQFLVGGLIVLAVLTVAFVGYVAS